MSDSPSNLTTAIARHWGWLMVVLAMAALVAGSYYLNGLQPRPPAPVVIHKVPANDPAVVKLSAEVDELEKTYHAGANATPPDPAATTALEQAVQKQRQLVELVADKDERPAARLSGLESQLEVAHAENSVARIDRLALEGQQLLDSGNLADAAPKFSEALQLQREVNSGHAPSLYKNISREADLDQSLAVAETEPLHTEMQDLLATARADEAANQPAAARANLVKARNLQSRINREHPTSPYANAAGGEPIDAEIETLAAEDLRNQSEAAEQEGDKAQTAGRAPEAADDYGLARARQLEINDKFRHSQFVSALRAETLEVKRQTSASVLTAELLAGQDRAITDLLRLRQPAAAAQKIAEAARTMDKLTSTFPKSERLDPTLKTRLDYLAAHSSKLVEVQRQVYENLRPVPGEPGRLLQKTEVTQELYVQVTDDSPSRNLGPGRPVDSVSWFDAQVFCHRLSWLLGLPARLPDESEFRAALGPDGGPLLWSHESSGDTSQPVGRHPPNAAGFCDLLGNVAEWLAADDAAGDAPVAGGSYLNPLAELLRVPVEPHPKNDRARHIGFRILVEQPLALPAPTAPAASAAPNLTGGSAPVP